MSNHQHIRKLVLSHQTRAFRIHGIPHAVFLTLTPRETFDTEKDYKNEKEYEETVWDYRFAGLMHIIYQMNADKKSKKLTVEDFLPARSKKRVSKPQTGDQLLSKLATFELAEKRRQERSEENLK